MGAKWTLAMLQRICGIHFNCSPDIPWILNFGLKQLGHWLKVDFLGIIAGCLVWAILFRIPVCDHSWKDNDWAVQYRHEVRQKSSVPNPKLLHQVQGRMAKDSPIHWGSHDLKQVHL